MRRWTFSLVLVLTAAATGVGVAGGMILAQGHTPPPAQAGPPPALPTLPTTPPESTSATLAATTTAPAPSTTAPATVKLAVAQQLEDGLRLQIDATEPVAAVVAWGTAGPPFGNTMRLPGMVQHVSVKLPLRTAHPVRLRVTARTADGRSLQSSIVIAKRLARQAVLLVADLRLDIPDGSAAVEGGFLGVARPLAAGARAPSALLHPRPFPATPVPAGMLGAPLTLRVTRQPAVGAPVTQMGAVPLLLPLTATPSRPVDRTLALAGVTVHVTVQVTITIA